VQVDGFSKNSLNRMAVTQNQIAGRLYSVLCDWIQISEPICFSAIIGGSCRTDELQSPIRPNALTRMPHTWETLWSVRLNMTATRPSVPFERGLPVNDRPSAHVPMGEFIFTPAPAALMSSSAGSLRCGGARIDLTWCTSALEEFIEAMTRIEADFARSWSRTGAQVPQGAADGSA